MMMMTNTRREKRKKILIITALGENIVVWQKKLTNLNSRVMLKTSQSIDLILVRCDHKI